MALQGFGDSLKKIFGRIAGYSVVSRELVEAVIVDLQRTLIRADVDVSIVSDITKRIRDKVLRQEIPKGMTLKEWFIKNLYDELVSLLGEAPGKIELKPGRMLLVGLFGSGKTTTAGKLAKWISKRGLSTGLVACDTHRAAARQQLEQLGSRIGSAVYSDGKKPSDIAKNAMKKAKESVLIFDSAGRDALDSELARELKELSGIVRPEETLLVIPAELGHEAGRQATEFSKLVGITGIVITRLDGTARGGAALAACKAAGAGVRFIGTGEQAEDLELYDPKRFVGQLIGYGDLHGLLEKARDAGIDEEGAKRLMRGKLTMTDFCEQIKGMQKMGSLDKILDMVPGMPAGVMKKLPKEFVKVQEGKMLKWQHIIGSMTPLERDDPDTINPGRIRRIAKGSGVRESDVRELLKSYAQVKKFMKMTGGGKAFRRGPFAKLAKQFGM